MQGFIVSGGGGWLSPEATLKMGGLIGANVFSSTSIFFLIAMLIRNANVYNTTTGIVSALVGFVTGVFIPLGVFPDHIKKVFMVIPIHHGATLMRSVMSQAPLASVFGNVSDQKVKNSFMTAQEIVDVYAAENGITYVLNGKVTSVVMMLTVVIGSGLLFLAISIGIMRRKKK
jgi:multidrug/hemolysin transport system permease protein